jgi:hypothetical protein
VDFILFFPILIFKDLIEFRIRSIACPGLDLSYYNYHYTNYYIVIDNYEALSSWELPSFLKLFIWETSFIFWVLHHVHFLHLWNFSFRHTVDHFHGVILNHSEEEFQEDFWLTQAWRPSALSWMTPALPVEFTTVERKTEKKVTTDTNFTA